MDIRKRCFACEYGTIWV